MQNFIRGFFDYLDQSHRIAFLTLSMCAVGLLVGSFLVPPLGVIDGSVLAGVGEIFAFSSLGTVLDSIHLNKKATVRKGALELSIGDVEKEQ